MTIVIAAIWGDKAVIAADTLVVASDRKLKNIKNFSKLIKFPDFIVGFAGSCAIFPVLQDFLNDKDYLKKKHMRMRSAKDALHFGKDIYEMLNGNLQCSPTYDIENDAGDIGEILILTKNVIYNVDPYMAVSEFTDFVMTGCGEDIGLGAMSVLYKTLKSEAELRQIVEESVKIVCDNNRNCSLPMQVMEL